MTCVRIWQFRSRNCPQYLGTGPIDQGETRHGGSAAWISRTSVIVQSDLENLGELQLVIRALLAGGIRELSNTGGIRGGGVTPFYRLARRGFFRGPRHVTSTSRHSGARHVKSTAYRYRDSTRHVVAT